MTTGRSNGRRASNQQTAQDYLLTLGTNISIMALGAVTGSVSAHLLHPAGRGQLTSIQLWPFLLAAIATFGMPESISFFTAKYRDNSRQYLTTAVLLALILSIPIVTTLYFLLPSILHNKGLSIANGARIFLLFVPLYALNFLPSQAVRGSQRFLLWNVLRILPNLSWFSVLIMFLLIHDIGHLSISAEQVTNAYLVALAVSAVVTCLVSWRVLNGPSLPSLRLWRPLMRYGIPVLGATIPVTLNLQLDQLVMTIITPVRQLGLYAVAVSWGGIVSPMLNSLGSLILPKIASLENESDQHSILTRALRASILIASITCPFGVILTPFAIKLIYGTSFDGSITSAYLLVIAGCFLGVSFILTESLLGLRYTKGPLRAQILGFLTMAVSLALLLPRYGILGAAISSLIGYSTNTLALVWEAKLVTGERFLALCIPKRNDVSALTSTLHGLIKSYRK